MFSISLGSTLSFDAWIRDIARSSAPQRMNSAFGATSFRMSKSGIDPPEPHAPAGLPYASVESGLDAA